MDHAVEDGKRQGLLSALVLGLLHERDYAAGSGTLAIVDPGVTPWLRSERPYSGGMDSDLGVLLVADDEAVARLHRDGWTCAASLVRRGRLKPFILKPLDALDASGLAAVVEDLDLVFPKH